MSFLKGSNSALDDCAPVQTLPVSLQDAMSSVADSGCMIQSQL